MRILGIESSCDETAAAVVENGNLLLSNVVATSMDLHAQYGGVVPEIAARSHIESIMPVIEKALIQAQNCQAIGLGGVQENHEKRVSRTSGTVNESRRQLTQRSAKSTESIDDSVSNTVGATDGLWDEIDGIAVTYGAGLGGSLLVGVMTARTLAITKNKPLFAINHVEAHVYANFLTQTALSDYVLPKKQPEFPLLALIVSGGHSQLVPFRDHFDYNLLGQTHDDAIGEAFDKVAKVLGLPYPGGPSIGKKALEGNARAYQFPKAKLQHKYDFSFSGLKTAVLRTVQEICGKDHTFPSFELAALLNERQKADVAASFQRVAVETVVDKTIQAYDEFQPKSVVIAGGVAASPELRRQLANKLPCPIEYTDPKLCTDNGAMVATLGCFKATHNQPSADPFSLDIAPNLSM